MELLISIHPVKIKFYSPVNFILETELDLGLTVVFNGLRYNFCRSIPHKCSARTNRDIQRSIFQCADCQELPYSFSVRLRPQSSSGQENHPQVLNWYMTHHRARSIQHPQLGAFVFEYSELKICFPILYYYISKYPIFNMNYIKVNI